MPDATISNVFLEAIYDPSYDIDWENENIRALLLDNTVSTDRTHRYLDDLSGELTDGSYSRVNVENRTATIDSSASPPRLILDSDNVVFSQLGGSTEPDRMVMFVQENDDTDSWILGYFEVRRAGSPITPTGDDLIIPPHNEYGWFSVREKSE